jgi:predicted membrane protein (TIGR00267 family)
VKIFGPREAWRQLRRYDRMVGIGKIARRYLVINAFDGTLTVLGLIVGSWVSKLNDPSVLLRTGYSTALAICVSGLWGAYMTETAERRDDLARLSRHTLTDLTQSDLGKAVHVASVFIALVNGLAPFFAASLVLIPFFLAPALGDIQWCYRLAVGIAFTDLFILGTFLGTVSGEHRLASGLKMLLAGLLCAALGYLIG